MLCVISWHSTGIVISHGSPFFLVQSLDPLPMHGRDLGVSPDDLMETPEQEAKQEILENKEVSRGSIAVVKEPVIRS